MEESYEDYLRDQVAQLKMMYMDYNSKGDESLAEACMFRIDELISQLAHLRAE